VQREFEKTIKQCIDKIYEKRKNLQSLEVGSENSFNSFENVQNKRNHYQLSKFIDETLEGEKLDDFMPGVIPSISNNLHKTNGFISNGRPNFRSMLQDAEKSSHI
jgi:hypothetical protein